MIQPKTLRIKSSVSLYQKKNRDNCRSLSLIDSNGKAQTYRKINLNQRLHTNSQQLKLAQYQSSHKKMSLLMNSFQQSKIKSVSQKKYDPKQYKTQNFITQQESYQQPKHQQNQQKQWVNSILPTMSAQALYEQNQLLKKQCNTLKQQNNKLMLKLVLEQKQKQKLAKQLSLENEYYNFYQRLDLFEGKQVENQKSGPTKPKGKMSSQLGFHPANYMIAGIKYRYQKLKSQYEQKCRQIEDMMKITNYTQIQEKIKQLEVLEAQNKRLVQKVINLETKQVNNDHYHQHQSKYQTAIMISNSLKSFKFKTAHQQNQLTTLIQAKNQSQIIKQMQKQNASQKKKIQTLQYEIQQKTSSMKSLHKSLTLVDNQLYYKNNEINKLKKLQKEIENKLLSFQNNYVKMKKKCQQEISNANKLNQHIFYKEKQIFMKQMEDKNQKIAKLQKEVSYLSSLLKYWKPLEKDGKSSIFQQSSQQRVDTQQLDEQGHLKPNLLLVSNKKKPRTKLSQYDKSIESSKSNFKELVLSLKPSEFEDVEIISIVDYNEQIKLRSPKTSRHKHSEKGFKARKINTLQIEYMKQQLRYRCMAKKLTIQDIRQYFSFKAQDFENITKTQLTWRQKYITMKELQSILISPPFILTKEEALRLSRFIVEDTSAEDIFCDEDNQIQRDIVKSIIKAFIGDYNLPNVQRCKHELKQILKQYGVNLKRALDALCHNQVVSPHKLFELMQSLGIEVSQQLRNQIVSRLYENNQSRNLNCLKYEMIFQRQFI